MNVGGVLVEKSISWKKNLFVLATSQFLAMVGFGCCMPFISLLLKDKLNIMDDSVRGLYMSIYSLVSVIGLPIAYPIWGTLGDRYGRKLMLLRASYMAGLIYPLIAFAPNYWWMLVARGLASMFSGTVNPAQTLVITVVPSEKRSMGLGFMTTAQWSGDMIGYLLGGVMVDALKASFGKNTAYNVTFLACGAIYIISGILVHLFVDDAHVWMSDEQLKVKAAAKKKPALSSILTPGVAMILLLFLLMGMARRITGPFLAMLVETIPNVKKVATITGYTSAITAAGGVVAGLLVGQLSRRFKPGSLLPPLLVFCSLSGLGAALTYDVYFLQFCRFLEFAAAGCVQPVLQVMLTAITDPKKHGAYLGWTASLNSFGGIVSNLISAPLAFYVGVRGIYVAAAVMFAVMIPVLIPTMIAYKKEMRHSSG